MLQEPSQKNPQYPSKSSYEKETHISIKYVCQALPLVFTKYGKGGMFTVTYIPIHAYALLMQALIRGYIQNCKESLPHFVRLVVCPPVLS